MLGQIWSNAYSQEKPAVALVDGSSKNQSCWGYEVYSHLNVFANVAPALSSKNQSNGGYRIYCQANCGPT
jgi:hypothetical protein